MSLNYRTRSKYRYKGHREQPKFEKEDYKWFSCLSCHHFCMHSRVTRPVILICVECLKTKTWEELQPVVQQFREMYPRFFQEKTMVTEN